MGRFKRGHGAARLRLPLRFRFRRWLRLGRCGDLRRKDRRDLGVRGGIKVDAVPLIKVGRDFVRIVDDDADAACAQVLRHRRDIGGPRRLGAEEAQIVGAGLQDDDVGAFGTAAARRLSMPAVTSPLTPAIGDGGVDAFLAQQRLQLRRIAFCAPTPKPVVLLAPMATMLSADAASGVAATRAAASAKARMKFID